MSKSKDALKDDLMDLGQSTSRAETLADELAKRGWKKGSKSSRAGRKDVEITE